VLVRRVAAVVLALIEVVLAAVVVWGMITGAGTQRRNGETEAWVVVVMLGLGAACLVVLGVGLLRAASLWRVSRPSAFAWFAGGLVLWVVWAFWRIIEDSS
jgi:hypothetical protein